MKRRISRILLFSLMVLLGGLALMIPRQSSHAGAPDNFDERDLRGAYTGTLVGFNAPGPNLPIAGVAKMTADGNGNLTFEGRVNVNGTFGAPPAHVCTYTIEASGFGTITCPGPAARTFSIIVSNGGQSFDTVVETSVLSGHFTRQ